MKCASTVISICGGMSYKYLKASRAKAGEHHEVLELNVSSEGMSNGVIVQHDKTRRYRFFPDTNQFWDWYRKQDKPMYHEIILGHVSQRLKFDIDAKKADVKAMGMKVPEGNEWETTHTNDPTKVMKYLMNELIEAILDVFYRLHFIKTGYVLGREHLAILSSCGPEKYSYHIIVMPYAVANNTEARHFTNVLMEYLGESCPQIARFVDTNVNSTVQGFRLTGSSKHDNDRVKRVIGSVVMENTLVVNHDNLPILPTCTAVEEKLVHIGTEDTEKVLNVVKRAGLMNAFEFYERIDNLFIFRRLGPSFCQICRRQHDNDNTLMVLVGDSEDRPVIQLCRHAPPGNRVILGKLEAIAGLEKILDTPVKPVYTSFDTLVEKKTVYCEPQMRPYERVPTLAVQGPMGTGKTKNMISYLEGESDQAIPKTILFVTFRQTFSEAMHASFDAGFEMYNEITGPLLFSQHPRLIVQVESLHRIRLMEGEKIDLVILDEMESVLSQFHSGLHKNFSASFMVFQILMDTSERVICMDANLGDASYTVLSEMRPSYPIHFHKNTYQSATEQKFHVTTQYNAWINTMYQELERGKRIVIPTNSKQEAQVIEKFVQEKFPSKKVMAYSSATDMTLRTEHFANVDRYWGNLDVLIYTPTVSAGISFEKSRFDLVFGYFNDMSCPVEDCRQMLGRVRKVSENKFYICIRATRSWHPTNLKELGELVQGRKNHLFRTSLNPELRGMMDFAVRQVYLPGDGPHKYTSPYYTLWLQHVRKTNISRNKFMKTFVDQVRRTGAQVTTSGYDGAPEVVFDKSRARKEIKDLENENIAGAKEISTPEFEDLIVSTDVSQDDKLAIQKFRLRQHYEMWDTEITPAFVEKYNKSRIKGIFFNMSQIGKYASLQQAVHAIQLEEVSMSTFTFQNVPRNQLSIREGWDLQRRYSYLTHYYALHILRQCGFQCVCDESVGTEEMLHTRLLASREDLFSKMTQLAHEFNINRPAKTKLNDAESYIRTVLSFYNRILSKTYGIVIEVREKYCFIRWTVSNLFNQKNTPELKCNIVPHLQSSRLFLELSTYVDPDPL